VGGGGSDLLWVEGGGGGEYRLGFLARVSIRFCSVGGGARERRRLWAVGWRSSDGSGMLGGVIRGLSGSVL
jgi:hypothetical protein